AGVEARLQTKIADIRPDKRGITLAIGGGPHTQTFDRVIVACGGKAYPALGSRGDLFPILESLGHHIVPIRPALAPLTADVRRFHKLQGVRLDVGLTLYEGDRVLGRTIGNMMFTEYGFSGPAAMDLAHLVSARPGTYLTLEINLLPNVKVALEELIARKRHEPFPVRVALGAVLPQKIPPLVMSVAGMRPDARLSELSDAERERLMETLTRLKATVTGTRGFQFAQVSTGGVPLAEVDPATMASRVVPRLHFAGEVLDVVGPCGGYNLQWAWTSGAIAGAGAAEGA
ncbi:MAG: aminoacetone oxidase family FAD-binding enzyme, partial [Anaerolineae bacterium]|nr:aminoacetone oxidase family FAD-binding enzyme [Anaerolineae bacterium]